MPMTAAALATALTPTITAALQAEFADETAGSPDAFATKITRLSSALATGIAEGLVPYIQAQSQVVNPAGAVIGTVL